jgi:excisionase family DNA binding protein
LSCVAKEMVMSEYLTAAEVAALLKVPPETVKIWLRSGTLSGVILSDRAGWRVHRVDVDRFLDAQREHGPIERRAGRLGRAGVLLGNLVAAGLGDLAPPGDGFADDFEEGRAATRRVPAGRDPWGS